MVAKCGGSAERNAAASLRRPSRTVATRTRCSPHTPGRTRGSAGLRTIGCRASCSTCSSDSTWYTVRRLTPESQGDNDWSVADDRGGASMCPATPLMPLTEKADDIQAAIDGLQVIPRHGCHQRGHQRQLSPPRRRVGTADRLSAMAVRVASQR